MEYLFVLSLILVVAIAGIGYFGQQTKKLADSDSTTIQNATDPNRSSSQSGP